MRFNRELQKPYVAAVIPAAGAAARMRGIDKQFEEVGGEPVIVRTLLALARSGWIDELVVAARPEDIPDLYALIREFEVPKVRAVVSGGETRQQSVLRGVAAVSPQARYVAVHDGARPLVTQTVIAEAVLAAIRHGAAAAAVPVVDTIKLADADRMITQTPDRGRLYAVQTPQVFLLDRYLGAVRLAAESGRDYTDDCQVMEAAGCPVCLSPGDYNNLKITTPVDLLVARALVEGIEELP